MISLYLNYDGVFIEFNSKKELDEYIIKEFNDDLTHLKVIHEYIGIYTLYDTDAEEYLWTKEPRN